MDRTIRTSLMLATAALLLVAAVPAEAQAVLKVGVFDSQRVSEESLEGKRIQGELAAISDAKQKELEAMQQELNDLRQRLNQQRLSLSTEKRAALEMEIQSKTLELNSSQDLASRKLQLEVAAAEAQYNEKMRQVLTRFAVDENFTLLLDASTVAYSASSIDVTTAITDLMDEMYPAASD